MAAGIKSKSPASLPKTFAGLSRMMPPMAIADDVQHENTVEMIDQLMQIDDLSSGQSTYMETLVELVEAYEARQHKIDLSDIMGAKMLRHLVNESGISATDLAKILDLHPTMGSKLIQGERRLTWDHAKILGRRFKVNPSLFMD
jgi:antitoxin component HigA of HigAB toxin-antitoxin module